MKRAPDSPDAARPAGSWDFVEASAIRSVAGALAPEVIELAALARGWTDAESRQRFAEQYKITPLLAADDLAVIRDGDALGGVASFRYLEASGEPVLHISNAAVRPELQRRGTMTQIALTALRRFRARLASEGRACRYVTLMTQSPAVYSAMAANGVAWPSPSSPSPAGVRAIARLIVETFNPGLVYEDDLHVIRDECRFYYRRLPRSDDPAQNALFDRSLRYEAGDVIVMVLDVSRTPEGGA